MFLFRRSVYLDNNATTRPSKRVIKRMGAVLRDCYGNPSSLYKDARDSAAALDDARSALAAAINAAPSEMIFTGSASEALNTVLKTAYELFPSKKILITPIEHSAVISTVQYLRGKGARIEVCPVDSGGFLRKDQFALMLGTDTSLVCCMFANNEIGAIQDIKALSPVARAAGALMLSDCVQALGKIPVDVRELGVDYAVFSAHKIHGPKGVGALYIKSGCPLVPLIHGGHQESGLRAGTEGIHNIAGFAAACAEVPGLLSAGQKLSAAKTRLETELRRLKPEIKVNSPHENCLPNTLSITIPGVVNSVLMGVLDFYGISVSAGSACNTQENVPSHVLKAIGLTDEEARSTIRLSLPEDITNSGINYVCHVLSDYFGGRCPGVTMFTPAQVGEAALLGGGLFILDVRFESDRRALKGLPGSREIPFFRFISYLGKVPRNKAVLVVCQAGFNAPLVAFYMRNKGFNNVGFLAGGLIGWKLFNPRLYEKHCGRDISGL